MEKFIFCIAIAIIGLIIILLINIYNRLQYNIIKLGKADVNIKDSLIKKHQILLRYIEFLEENGKLEKKNFEEFIELNIKNLSNVKLMLKIDECYNEIKSFLDDNEKLLKNETVININKEIREQDIIINSCKKYYNNNLINYNKLVKCFPSKFVAKMYKYKEKEFYPEDKKDNLKILEEE